MSDHEPLYKDLYYGHDQLFQVDQEYLTSSSKLSTSNMSSSSSTPYNLQGFDVIPTSYMSFTECLQGSSMDYNSLITSTAFGLSPSSSEVFSSIEVNDHQKPLDHHHHHHHHPSLGDHLGSNSSSDQNPVTPRDHSNSISSSSTEAGAEEDSPGKKDGKPKEPLEDGEDDPKKV